LIGDPGWTTPPALHVHYHYADPGDEGIEWSADFFVDDQGRLIGERRTRASGFTDEPSLTSDIVYHWEDGRVWWAETEYGQTTFLELSWSEAGYQMKTGGQLGADGRVQFPSVMDRQDLGPNEDGWTWQGYRSSWSPDGGYQFEVPPNGTYWFGTRTSGSRIEFLSHGSMNEFMLVDRRPSEVVGTYYGNYVEKEWVPIGTARFQGPGIRAANRVLLLIDAQILERRLDQVPLWPRFLRLRSPSP